MPTVEEIARVIEQTRKRYGPYPKGDKHAATAIAALYAEERRAVAAKIEDPEKPGQWLVSRYLASKKGDAPCPFEHADVMSVRPVYVIAEHDLDALVGLAAAAIRARTTEASDE